MENTDGVSAKPVWRGKFKIPGRDIDIDVGAYLCSKSSNVVGKVAEKMPDTLRLEMFAWGDVWPAWFTRVQPTEFSIHVLFLSEGSDGDRLDSLLSDVMSTEFALKAKMDEVELLIFTSYFLPERLQRYQGKFYLWGVFMGQIADFRHKSDSDAREMLGLSSNPGNSNAVKCMDGPVHIPSENRALKKHPAKSKKRGRQLDDGWSHAKPFDELRQKSECKYCGFVSEHGGISRLKAHLAGGSPRLPVCHKVPTEVKIVMNEWYREWVKNTKAYWVTDLRRASSPMNLSQKGAEDDAWEHATRLDEKEILAGGNPAKNLEGCSDAPPDVKTLMSIGISEKTKGTKIGKVEMELQEDEKTSDSPWRYDRSSTLQKILDEVKNTSLKASLQKLMDKA